LGAASTWWFLSIGIRFLSARVVLGKLLAAVVREIPAIDAALISIKGAGVADKLTQTAFYGAFSDSSQSELKSDSPSRASRLEWVVVVCARSIYEMKWSIPSLDCGAPHARLVLFR